MNDKKREKFTLRNSKTFWTNDVEIVIAIVILLLVIGSINIFSSSFIISGQNFESPYFFLSRQITNVIVGVIVFAVCYHFDYHIWRKWIVFALAFTFVTLILVLFFGTNVNGAKRWIQLGIIQLQPAEMAKLVSIILMAAYISVCIKFKSVINFFSLQMGLILIMSILTEREPDMGTALIILGIPVLMLIIAGLNRKKILTLLGTSFLGFIILIFQQPYRLERLKVLYDPWLDAQHFGYQTIQSLLSIGSGEIRGMGLGMGVSKYGYLPESHTDFAFAIFCQENGFLGALLVFILFAVFTIYGTRIAINATDEYGQILALGITLLVSVQAMANLFMVSGMIPVVGVPLPFISYGGTSLLVTMAAIGILVNISKVSERNMVENKSSRGD